MPKKPPGPKAAALGAELRSIRTQAKMSITAVITRLGWSTAKLSRLETGNRNIAPEDVSALLAIYGVTGSERDRLLAMARTPDEASWLDRSIPGLPVNMLRLAQDEARAIRATDWALALVPGLLQDADYTIAYMLANGIPAGEVGARLMARQQRQQNLDRLEYTAYLDESILYRRVGGPRVLRDQLRRMIDLASDGRATIRITPYEAVGHVALTSSFLLYEFEDEPCRVYGELLTSTVVHTGDLDPQPYVEAITRLEAISLDVEESLRLLRTAAGAIEGGT